jgi:hypothetical protein
MASHEDNELALGMQLTAVFQRVPGGYVAFVEELPGEARPQELDGGTTEPSKGVKNARWRFDDLLPF